MAATVAPSTPETRVALRPTRSPTRTSTPAGRRATGARPRSTSPRTASSGARPSRLERQAALWNYALFFHGEDAVADNLSPYIDAAPREEQKYFLTTQQVDEARHAVFFGRFMKEVVETGADTSPARSTRPARADLGLPQDLRPPRPHGRRAARRPLPAEARRGRSRSTTWSSRRPLAQPGQHFIEDYLVDRDVLPGFRAGMRNVALDEQRHIGFGVKMIADLIRMDPECQGRGRAAPARGHALHRRRLRPARLGRALRDLLRLRPRGHLRGGRHRHWRPSSGPPGCLPRTCRAAPASRSTSRRASAPSAASRCCAATTWARRPGRCRAIRTAGALLRLHHAGGRPGGAPTSR